MRRFDKDQIRRLSRSELEDVSDRDHAFAMAIREIRRNLDEFDDSIGSCNIKEMVWSLNSASTLAAVAYDIARQELAGGMKRVKGEPLSPELCHKIFDEVDDTYEYIMGAGKRAEASCECKRKK